MFDSITDLNLFSYSDIRNLIFILFGGISILAWTAIELWTIGSFMWAYIDEHKWQLPKAIEMLLRKIPFYDNEVINSINYHEWAGSGKEDPLGGRACFVTIGFVCRIIVCVILSAILALVWPATLVWLIGWISLRSLRFMRRTQKTVGKLAKVAHEHKDGQIEPANIKRPEF